MASVARQQGSKRKQFHHRNGLKNRENELSHYFDPPHSQYSPTICCIFCVGAIQQATTTVCRSIATTTPLLSLKHTDDASGRCKHYHATKLFKHKQRRGGGKKKRVPHRQGHYPAGVSAILTRLKRFKHGNGRGGGKPISASSSLKPNVLHAFAQRKYIVVSSEAIDATGPEGSGTRPLWRASPSLGESDNKEVDKLTSRHAEHRRQLVFYGSASHTILISDLVDQHTQECAMCPRHNLDPNPGANVEDRRLNWRGSPEASLPSGCAPHIARAEARSNSDAGCRRRTVQWSTRVSQATLRPL